MAEENVFQIQKGDTKVAINWIKPANLEGKSYKIHYQVRWGKADEERISHQISTIFKYSAINSF